MTSTLGTNRLWPPTFHATRPDGSKIPPAPSAVTPSSSLAKSVASSHTSLLATLKQEQSDFLRLAKHFSTFSVDASVSPRVADAVESTRKPIATRANDLQSKPPVASIAASAPTTNHARSAASPSRPSWASIAKKSSPSATSIMPLQRRLLYLFVFFVMLVKKKDFS